MRRLTIVEEDCTYSKYVIKRLISALCFKKAVQQEEKTLLKHKKLCVYQIEEEGKSMLV